MNWDQIEDKWVAITRRMRSDWPVAKSDDVDSVDEAGIDTTAPTQSVVPDQKPFPREVV